MRIDGALTPGKAILSGVMFYQYATTETECGVKAHGPNSVYHQVFKAICEP